MYLSRILPAIEQIIDSTTLPRVTKIFTILIHLPLYNLGVEKNRRLYTEGCAVSYVFSRYNFNTSICIFQQISLVFVKADKRSCVLGESLIFCRKPHKMSCFSLYNLLQYKKHNGGN